jgi:hypothetical protein
VTVRDGYPRLRPGVESSILGLHFVGAPAAVAARLHAEQRLVLTSRNALGLWAD